MVHVQSTSNTTGLYGGRSIQDNRKEVREALKRADLDIVTQIPGDKSGDKSVGKMAGKLFSYQVSGKRVSDSTDRYYMKTRLEKLSEKLDIHVEMRRVARNSPNVFIDVFPTEEMADEARHAEDVRRAENPSTPASKYYYRSKAGLTGKGRKTADVPAAA